MPVDVEARPIAGISSLACRPAPKAALIDRNRLEREDFERRPDVDDPNQQGPSHLEAILGEAEEIVNRSLTFGGESR